MARPGPLVSTPTSAATAQSPSLSTCRGDGMGRVGRRSPRALQYVAHCFAHGQPRDRAPSLSPVLGTLAKGSQLQLLTPCLWSLLPASHCVSPLPILFRNRCIYVNGMKGSSGQFSLRERLFFPCPPTPPWLWNARVSTGCPPTFSAVSAHAPLQRQGGHTQALCSSPPYCPLWPRGPSLEGYPPHVHLDRSSLPSRPT